MPYDPFNDWRASDPITPDTDEPAGPYTITPAFYPDKGEPLAQAITDTDTGLSYE